MGRADPEAFISKLLSVRQLVASLAWPVNLQSPSRTAISPHFKFETKALHWGFILLHLSCCLFAAAAVATCFFASCASRIDLSPLIAPRNNGCPSSAFVTPACELSSSSDRFGSTWVRSAIAVSRTFPATHAGRRAKATTRRYRYRKQLYRVLFALKASFGMKLACNEVATS